MPVTDNDLLTHWIENRDAEAFRAIALRHSPMVYATCLRILRNAADAEDVTQECFQRLAFRLKEPIEHLSSWLHRVATNLSITRIRAEGRRRQRESSLAKTAATAARSNVQEIIEHVDAALEELPMKLRAPLVLHFLENRTHERTAELLGVARGTVTYRIGRGIEELRKKLARHGIPVAALATLETWLGANLSAGAVPASLASALGHLALAGPGRSGMVTKAIASLTGAHAIKAVVAIAILGAGAVLLWGLGGDDRDVIREKHSATPIIKRKASTTGEGVEVAAVREEVAREDPAEEKPSDPVTETIVPPAIAGHVFVDETGEPLENVEVVLEPEGERRDAQRTHTAGDGSFHFHGLEPGAYLLKRPHWVPGLPGFHKRQAIHVELEVEQILEDVDLAVVMGIRVAGQVVDEAGRPVAGADVVGRDRNDIHQLQRYRTKEDGTFELFGFRPTGAFALEAGTRLGSTSQLMSDVYGPVALRQDGLSDVALVLHDTGRLRGRLLDTLGRPVVEASVTPGLGERASIRYLMNAQDRTDAEGTFDVRGLAEGTYKTWVQLPDGSITTASPPWQTFQVEWGETIESVSLIVELKEPGDAISGRLLNEREEPIEGAEISVSRDGQESRFRSSDREGRFEITGLKAGAYRLRVDHDDYVNAAKEGVVVGEDIEIVLADGATLSGRVVDAVSGEPVTAFELFHLDADNRGRVGVRGRFREFREAEGRFRVDGLEPGFVSLVARAPGYGESSVDVSNVALDEVRDDVEIRLVAGLSLSGVVLDTAGNPVVGAGIILGPLPREDNPEAVATARTDDNGTFEIHDVSAALKRVSAVHMEYATVTAPLELSAAVENHVTLVLPRGGAVEGAVYYEGRPWAGQSVSLRGGSNRGNRLIQTDADGLYRFENVPPGDIEVRVSASLKFDAQTKDRRRISQPVKVEDAIVTTQDFRFQVGNARVHGVVTLDGRPAPVASLVLHAAADPTPEYRRAIANSEGRYEFNDVPAGEAKLVVETKTGSGRRSVEFSIEAGAVISQDVMLEDGVRLGGTVTGLRSGEMGAVFALAGSVEIDREGLMKVLMTNFVRRVHVPKNGPFQLDGLDAGTFTIVAIAFNAQEARGTPPDELPMRITSQTVTVAKGSTPTIDVAFE